MADLSPDTSIYRPFAQQGQSLDLGSLINIVRGARELQTQSAISNAIKSSTDPNTGQPNPSSAITNLMRGPAIVGSDDMTHLIQMQSAQSKLNQDYATQVGHDVGTLITNPNLTGQDILARLPLWRRYNVPEDIIANILHQALPNGPNGPVNRNGLAQIKNWADSNAALPMAPQETLTSGQTRQRPAGETMYPGQNASGGGGGGGGAGGGVGSVVTSLPSGGGLSRETAAHESTSLLSLGPTLSNNRSMLLTLGDLSHAAATGPTAPLEKEVSELAQRFGYKGTMSATDLGATESYAKIAATLQQQMATSGFGGLVGGHATDAFLANAQSAMPGLNLSRLGREGITHWLLGNNDAMQVMQSEWAKWIAQHPNMEGEFQHWLYGQLPAGMGQGFNVTTFDPRVFQYERMTPEEQTTFQSMIKGKGELARFARNVQQYEQRGWIGPNGIANQ